MSTEYSDRPIYECSRQHPAPNYAKGSSGKLCTQIYIGMEVGYIDRETGKAWIDETRKISRML